MATPAKSPLAKMFRKTVKKTGKGGPGGGDLAQVLSMLQGMEAGAVDMALVDQIKAELDRLSAPPAPAPDMGAAPMGMPPMGGAPAGLPPGLGM